MIALLYTQNVFAKTHNGTRKKFEELFIKTALLTPELSKIIADLFAARQSADYEISININMQEAEILIVKASRFYATTFDYFQRHS